MAACTKLQVVCSLVLVAGVLLLILLWTSRTTPTDNTRPGAAKINPLPVISRRRPPQRVDLDNDALRCDAFFLPTSIGRGNRTTPLIEDKYTIIMPAFRRSDILGTVLKRYCNITEVDKIILVWNNVNDEPPFRIGNDINCGRQVLVLNQSKNLITNRYRPTSYVETEAVFSLDDDLLLSHDDVSLAFSTWKRFKHLIVGFYGRVQRFNPKTGKYIYGTFASKEYSMILMGAAFIHQCYLSMYFTNLDPEILDYVHKYANGEDITMNAVVADYLATRFKPQCCGIHIEPRNLSTVEAKTKSGYAGKSHEGTFWPQRTNILNMLVQYYGHMPLISCTETVSQYSLFG